MNLCEAINKGKDEQRAIRGKDWPINLAWFHGMDNKITWYNSDPNSPCEYKTGDRVSFAVADFWSDEFDVHPDIPYHGNLGLNL